ncbi:MAG: hypothetical protein Q9163_003749 [Psora crenata]
MEASKRDFHHPYKPYDIQVDLMNAIYDCIDKNQVGIFESPTGTGKSLSLICSALTWLREFQGKAFQSEEAPFEDPDEPAWVRQHAREERKRAIIEQKSDIESRLKQIRAEESRERHLYEKGDRVSKRFKPAEDDAQDPDDVARFELDEYDSEDEERLSRVVSLNSKPGVSAASLELMQKLGLTYQAPQEDNISPIDEVKVLYSSRTHTQLTQFVRELRRVDLPAPSWVSNEHSAKGDASDKSIVVKHVSLGSRKNLCINPQVAKLGSVPAINERCLELQQRDTPQGRKCTFVPTKENRTLVNDFRDHTLAAIRDIEELGGLGKKFGLCPYYASRTTIKPSEVVTLPYPLMLQKSAREALDLSLRGHVVIIDEAHNLIDTISNIHSVTILGTQLRRCRLQLNLYLQKFRNRLKGKNRVYIAQLVRVIESISSYLEGKAKERSTEGLARISDLMAGKGADQVNLHKLVQYLQQSKLARKVESYVQYQEQSEWKDQAKSSTKYGSSTIPVLTHVQAFFQALSNPAAEGRFFYEGVEGGDLALKYMLLDPTYHFREVIEDARAVILAGGTMSPMDDYARNLFPYLDQNRLKTWSCGHIIPKDNLLALPVSTGPGGTDFDFTFKKRNSLLMIDALGDCLTELAGCIPDGLTIFFPSYAYLDQVVARWKTSRNLSRDTRTVWDCLLAQKPIFQETRTTASTDTLFADYSLSISTNRGGLLLSVIGGKLSEGINFSDALGRGVVVVGLPFPNIQSAQWKAKLEYIEQSTTKRTGSVQQGKEASREFYENACMRAVNQSIGRAIRHKGDYASILLLDRRYQGAKIEGKLPGWIREGLVKEGGFGKVVERLRRFYEAKERGSRRP